MQMIFFTYIFCRAADSPVKMEIYYSMNKQGRDMETNQKTNGTYGSQEAQIMSEAKHFEHPNYSEDSWIGAWSTTPVRFDLQKFLNLKKEKHQPSLTHLTFRTELRPTIGGSDMRIMLSNVFGQSPLTVDAVTVARGAGKSACKVDPETIKKVTFDGKETVTMEPGTTVMSDPIGMEVEALERIVFSFYLKKSGMMRTYGMIGGHTYAQFGNHTMASNMVGSPMRLSGNFGEYAIIPMLCRVEVYAPGASSAVLIGDSTIANDIPLMIAEKLQKAGISNVGILQQAVKGNRLMDNGVGKLGMVYGESMLERFERDALNQPGVKKIFIKVGDNDIIHPQCKSMKGLAKYVTADEMIGAYKELIERAHAKDIKVYMFTRTAWRGYTRNFFGGNPDVVWTTEIDEMRKEINRWIRSDDSPADGWIDLDYLCGDDLAEEMSKEYTTDGIHFSPKGQQTVVENLSLEYFQ